MADEIKHSDLIQKDALPKIKRDTKKVREEFQALEKDIISLLGTSAQLAKAFKSPKDAKEIKALAKAISDIEKQDKALIATRKELIKVDKQIEKERLAEIKLAKAREKAFDDFEKQEKKNIATAQKARKATLDNANAFKKLTKQTNIAQARFKRLAAQYGITSKIAETARKRFEKLDNKLRQINNTARDGRRDVGRYGLAFQKLKGFLSTGLGALGITAGIAGLGRVIGNVIGVFSGFEKSNSQLQAVLGESGTKGNMDLLKQSAKELGATTAFTASQVTELQTEFAKLGFDPKSIDNATESTLALAAASGVDLAEAASVVGGTLGGFNLKAEETSRVADVMAKSFSISALDMEKFRESMKNVAPAANAVGLSVEKTTALLGTLAKANISGSKAGSGLATGFVKLKAKGIDLEKALIDIKGAADPLTKAVELVGLNAAKSFLVLANGTETTKEYEESLLNAEGAAQKMADTMLDNLAGSITILGSAWEGFILSLEDGEGKFSSLLRTIVDVATELLSMATGTAKAADELDEAGQRVRNIANAIKVLAKVVGALLVSFIAYKATVKAINIATKLYTLTTNALRIAQIALKGGLKGATKAMKGFNTASKANIIGALVALLALAVTAFLAFRDSAKEAAKAQREVNAAMRDNDKLTKSIEERLAILNELNKTQLQTLLSNIQESKEKLELDKKLTEQQLLRIKQLNDVNDLEGRALTNKEKLNIATEAGLIPDEKSKFTLSERRKILDGLNITEEHFLFLKKEKIASDRLEVIETEKLIATTKEKIDVLEEERKLVQARLDFLNKTVTTEKEGETDLIKIQLERLKQAKGTVASTTAQVAARNILIKSIQEQINALRALGEAEQEGEGIDASVTNQTDQALQARRQLELDMERLDSEREFRRREIAAREIENEAERDAAFLLIAQDKLDAELNFLNREANAKERAILDNAYFRRQIELQSAFESIKLTIETERQKRVALAQTNEEVIAINAKARRDQKAASEKFKNELELEQAKLNNELLALNLEQARQQEDVLNEKVDNEKKANEKILEDEKALNEKRKQENLDLFNSIASATKEAISDRNKENAKLIDDEIKRAQDSVDRQREIAAKGQENILGEEQARLDKANLEKRREAERAAKQEQNIALAIGFLNNLAARQKAAKNKEESDAAFGLALRDTIGAKIIAETFASFFDGTEDTGTVANPLDSKGGRKVIVHDNERVMTKKQNDRMGGISNDNAADIVYNHMHGLDLSPSHFKQLEVGKMMQPNPVNLMPMIAKLGEQTDRLEAAFKKGQTQITTHWNEHGDATEKIYKNGITKLRTFKRPRLG